MASLKGNGAGGAALDTGCAAVFRHAVFVVLDVSTLRGFQRGIDNDGAVAACLATLGDQTVAQAEGAKAGDVGRVALGPVGHLDKFLAVAQLN